MLPPIPAPRIAPIDEGSPLWKPYDIPEEPLPSSPPRFIIDENMQTILSALHQQKDKGKKPITESFHSGPPPKEKLGWSQDKIN